MPVEGVRNLKNNTGLYAIGAGLVGAGAGAAVGYYTRPFLKDGAPTDEFVKKVNNNLVDILDEGGKKQYFDGVEGLKKIDKVGNAEELKELCRNNELIKQFDMLDNILEAIDEAGFEKVKPEIKKIFQIHMDSRKDVIEETLALSWDKNAKKFIYNAEKISKEEFEVVKKAARGIQGKYAAIYGSVGAAVLGLGTLLCCGGKKSEG